MADRGLRSDAVVSRRRLVDAARAELSRTNGSVDDLRMQRVAKEAGVGQGTLYRHFPTREHLLAEVYRSELTELVEAAAPLASSRPPLETLTAWLDRLLEYARVKRGVMAAIEASAWRELYADHGASLHDTLQGLLDSGRASGEVRDDVDATDVILLLGALSRIPEPEWDARAPTVVAMVVDALRSSVA